MPYTVGTFFYVKSLVKVPAPSGSYQDVLRIAVLAELKALHIQDTASRDIS